MRPARFLFHCGILIFILQPARAQGQRPAAAVPDAVYYNGRVITVDKDFSIQQAFATKGEEFFAVGTTAAMRALAGPRTQLIDLKGYTVIPGLMDNHIHQYNAAWVEYRGIDAPGIDTNGIKTKQELLDRIHAAATRAAPGEPLITNIGWAAANIPAPTRAELDLACPDHILVVMRARGTAYLNSMALKAAGITRDTKQIAGNEIPKDKSGEPTGQIGPPGTVNTVVPAIVPWPKMSEQEEMLAKMQERHLALGLTSIREVELKPEGMRAYQALRRDGRLKMRVSMGLDFNATDWEKLESTLREWGVQPGFGDHWLRLDSISEFAMDSNVNIALFREPKLTTPDLGTMRITAGELRQAMLVINRYGWRPAIHITGDGTLDKVLDAYEAADRESSIKNKRWIVEHIPFVQPDQIDRIARLGVLVSAQSQPYEGTEGSKRILGEARANRSVPMRELLDKKVLVSSGSDFPGGGSDNPLLAFYFYVTRKTADGSVSGPEQKITRQEALRVATVNNAYMTWEEDVKGSIEPGKLADFVILSENLMTVPEEKILQIKVLGTFVGGKKMYAAAGGGF